MQSGNALRFFGVGTEPIKEIGANIRGLDALRHVFRDGKVGVVRDLVEVVVFIPHRLFTFMVLLDQSLLVLTVLPLCQYFFRFTLCQGFGVIFVSIKLLWSDVCNRHCLLTRLHLFEPLGLFALPFALLSCETLANNRIKFFL